MYCFGLSCETLMIKRSSPLLSAVAEPEGLLFIMPHRRDSAIFVMLRIPAYVTDSLRC